MSTFPMPHLIQHLLQDLPQPGTPLTEAALLDTVRTQLRPMDALACTLATALEHERLTSEVTVPLLSLLSQVLGQVVQLLDVWKATQAVEGRHRTPGGGHRDAAP